VSTDLAEGAGPFGRLAAWVLQHRPLVAGLTLLITVVAAWIGLPPQVDTDMMAMLPADEPAVVALKKLHEEEGGANLITLAFTGEDPERLLPYLERVATELQALPTVQFAVHRIDPDLAKRVGLLQLAPEDLDTLEVRLRGALALGSALNPIVVQRLMDMGPVTERIARAGEGSDLLGGADGHARILVRPRGSSHDQDFAERVMEQVHTVLDKHPPEASGASLQWIGGAYHNNVEDVRAVSQDIVKTSSVSALLVLLVIIVAFRSLRATILVFLPLFVANIVNLAVLRLAVGSVNTFTSMGTAVLLGLGIDFAVHLVGRYREERAKGQPVEEAVVWAWDRTGPPCTTAAVTSAAGFAALGAGQFRGFSQLGLVLGIGLMLCLVSMLVLLPLLLPLLDPKPRGLLGTGTDSYRRSRSTYRLAPVGLMAIVVLTGALGARRLPELAFEYDSSALRREGMAYSQLTEAQRRLTQQSYSPVLASLPDRATLLRDHRRLERLIEDQQLPHVGRVLSIENLIPSDQSRRIDSLSALKELTTHRNLRYLPPPVVKPLLSLTDWEAIPVTREQLPEGILALVGAEDDRRHRLLLFPQGNMVDLREANKLAKEVERALPGAEVTGEYLVTGALFRLVNRDMPLIGVLAFFMVAMITLIDLRRPSLALGALGALLAGMIWAGSAVELAGVKLSIMNVVGIPILLGIGVDVVIHLMHRLNEEGPGGVRRSLRTTGVAAAVSTLTTLLSFFALQWASTIGVRSLGTLVVIGLSSVFLATVTVLPTAWAAGWRIQGLAPGEREPWQG
jgi:predicted RND superfamily exporter protein